MKDMTRAGSGLRLLTLGLLVGAAVFASYVPTAEAAEKKSWLERKMEQAAEKTRQAAQATKNAAANMRAASTASRDPVGEAEGAAPEGSVAQDALNAAAVCGTISTVTGGSRENAIWSGVTCGAANGALTWLGNNGKKKYAADYQRISEEMAVTQQEIDTLESQEADSRKSAARIEKDIKRLVAREKDDKKFIAKAKVLRKELGQELSDVKQSTAKANAKIAIIDKQIADLDVIIADSPELEDLKTTRTALVAQKSKLIENVKGANSVNTALLAQKSNLDDEIIERG